MRRSSTLFLVLLSAVLAAVLVPPRAAAQNEPWRTAAEARIEQHRKGTLRLVVRDADGAPVPGATVRVAMQEHAFGFGTAISLDRVIGPNRDDTYRSKLTDLTGDGRSFNRVTPGNSLKWEPWETNWPISRAQKINALLWLRLQGFDFRGHNLLWPAWQWLPDDIYDNRSNPTYIRDRLQSHTRGIMRTSGIRGVTADWDVLNEPVHLTELRDAIRNTAEYATGEELYVQAFEWAREADPDAKLWVNEYNIISVYNTGWQAQTRRDYENVIRRMIDAGAPIDGIGFQGHVSPGGGPTPTQAYAVLEQYAALGTELAVTEYDYAYSSNNSTSCRKADENSAAAYLRDFMTVVFSHPQSESFTIWGFWDGDHWRCDAVMYRDDWTLKPSGQTYLDLVFDAWWTDETLTADADGVVTLSAFHGDYEVAAETPAGTVERTLSFTSTDTTTFFVSNATTIDAERDAALPGAVILEGNYPNPFNPQTTIRYALPAPADVRLDVYDALGRRVARLVDGPRAAGRHEAAFDADGLPGGVYLYRLTADGVVRTGRMHLLK